MHRYAALLLLACGSAAVAVPTSTWELTATDDYVVVPDVEYLVADGHSLTFDLYRNQRAGAGTPLLVFFHGGGWVGGSKEASQLNLLPYLARGWHAANVEYRLTQVAGAPAAIEDARCVLRYLAGNADDLGIDTTRTWVSGRSAGGHLALMAALLDEDSGYDYRCGALPVLRPVGAIVWFPVTDLVAMSTGPHARPFARAWLGHYPADAVHRLSAGPHVHPQAPPVITLHGDADGVIPLAHSEAFHGRLAAAGVGERLVAIPGGGHANFSAEQMALAFAAIFEFVAQVEAGP